MNFLVALWINSKFLFSQLESTSFQTPPHLNNKLIEKCEDFETVCDQIYFILVSSHTRFTAGSSY
jgi:hypothetical protein